MLSLKKKKQDQPSSSSLSAPPKKEEETIRIHADEEEEEEERKESKRNVDDTEKEKEEEEEEEENDVDEEMHVKQIESPDVDEEGGNMHYVTVMKDLPESLRNPQTNKKKKTTNNNSTNTDLIVSTSDDAAFHREASELLRNNDVSVGTPSRPSSPNHKSPSHVERRWKQWEEANDSNLGKAPVGTHLTAGGWWLDTSTETFQHDPNVLKKRKRCQRIKQACSTFFSFLFKWVPWGCLLIVALAYCLGPTPFSATITTTDNSSSNNNISPNEHIISGSVVTWPEVLPNITIHTPLPVCSVDVFGDRLSIPPWNTSSSFFPALKQFLRNAAIDLVRIGRTRPGRTVFAGVDMCAPLAMMAFLPNTQKVDSTSTTTTTTTISTEVAEINVNIPTRPLVLLDPVFIKISGMKQATNESHRHCPQKYKSYERYSIIHLRGWNALSLQPVELQLQDNEARLAQHFLSWHHGDSPCHS